MADFDTFARLFQEQESDWERARRISALLGVEPPPYHSDALVKWRFQRDYFKNKILRELPAFERLHAIRLSRVCEELTSYFDEIKLANDPAQVF